MKKQLFMLCVVLAAVCTTLAWAFDVPDAKMRQVKTLPISTLQKTVKKSAANNSTDNLPAPSCGVSIGTVDAVLYSESGLDLDYFDNVQYVAQTSANTYMGFIVYHWTSENNLPEDEREYFMSLETIYSTDEMVTVPDSLRIGGNNYPVYLINQTQYDYLDYGFNNSSISTLTLPQTILIFNNYRSFDANLSAMYMLGQAPQMYTSPRAAKIYVCNKDYVEGYYESEYFAESSILPYGWDFDWLTVNVEKPGEFADTYLTENNFDWSVAKYLKITGNINSIDLDNIKNLSNLVKLDISETNVEEIPSEYMKDHLRLNEVKLPSSIKKLGEYAFYGCKSLSSVDLKGVREIGNFCFQSCHKLTDVNVSDVESIGDQAFCECIALSDIDLSSVYHIGQYAFYSCHSLTEIDLNSASEIGYAAFYDCSGLRDVKFGEKLRSIGGYSFACSGVESIELPEGMTVVSYDAFQDCQKLKSVKLPQTMTVIGDYAFAGCASLLDITLPFGLVRINRDAFNGCMSLKSIEIPSTVNEIRQDAFADTGITEFICNAAVPPTAGGKILGDGRDMTQVYLFVPPFSKDYYRSAQYWSDFFLMRSIQTPVDFVRVDRKVDINLDEESNAVLANNPTIVLTRVDSYLIEDDINVGQLTATGEGTLSAGVFNIYSVLTSRYLKSYNECPTLINYAEKMRAEVVNHSMSLYDNSTDWHFISLPYDVKVSDIIPSDDTYWVIRRYDSAARAAGEMSSTWLNLTEDDVMEGGKGYIVSITGGDYIPDGSGNRYIPRLYFTSGDSTTKNNIFRTKDVTVALDEYVAEFPQNRSWNLIGNPYPCYFDMHCLNEGFNSPVTVWTGRAYVAYSPVDDDLVLSPYEAFFVQCPPDAKEMTFKESGRLHSDEGRPRYKTPTMADAEILAEGRNVFNFNVSGMDSEDRARIVLNPEAEMSYEVGRDASKFFAQSGDGIQLYVASGALCSIDERPVADGTATLGVRVAKDGEYTISLDGRYSSEWRVILTDNVTGHVMDLTEEDYAFEASKGENSGRFSVQFRIGTSGMEGIDAEFSADSIVTVTSADGIVVYTGCMGNINVNAAGLYIISDGNASCKAILK